MASKNDAKFRALYDGMLAAGAAAAAKATPTPMIVSEDKPGGKSWFVAGGVCGFGWVNLRGTSAFGRWLAANGLARKDWPTGLAISSKLMTQSMELNAAWAHGAADFLNANGISASGRSRID